MERAAKVCGKTIIFVLFSNGRNIYKQKQTPTQGSNKPLDLTLKKYYYDNKVCIKKFIL